MKGDLGFSKDPGSFHPNVSSQPAFWASLAVWANAFIFRSPFGQFTNKEQEIADIRSGDLAFESQNRHGVKVRLDAAHNSDVNLAGFSDM